MNATPELVALVQREREATVRSAALARLAACVRARCDPSLLERVARAMHLRHAACEG